MTIKTPEIPENSFRITLELENNEVRLDTILLDSLRKQDENDELKAMSKTLLKKLVTQKKVLIKGQSAKAKSPIQAGTTYVDILLGE
jgi:hypothetical protein